MPQPPQKAQSLGPIVQPSLGRIVGDRLRGLILSGDLPPGAPLKERELGLALGVSRTPVREALAELEDDGLAIIDGRHFVVAPLRPDEIAEIYSMLAGLERAAIRQIVGPTERLVSSLAEIRKRSKRATSDVRSLAAADSDWHRTLVEASGNRRLGDCAERLRTIALRYELAYFADAGAERSVAQHLAIERLLALGDLSGAADAVERHWLGNIEAMNRAIGRR